MMLDIDNFKKINDTYGHTAGDEALQQVANRLKEMQSQILTSYRFAGDEFILILRSSQNMLVEDSVPVQTGIHKGCGALRYEAEDRRQHWYCKLS